MINNAFTKRYIQLGCECSSIDLRQSLRVNTIKISEKELIRRLAGLKIRLEKIPYLKEGYYYDAGFSLGATAEYLMGYYYLQEAASQIPAQVLSPGQEDVVLDMAASPGSKTTQLSQIMKNKGRIVALDTDPRRLLALRNNIERCGIKNVIVYKKDARFSFDLGIKFDKILLDAPCSGNYVVEKDFFQKKSIDGVRERARLQRELLKSAMQCLKKGGTLVYSTCSLEPEENELNIDWFIKKYPEMRLEDIDINIGDAGLTDVFGTKLNPDIRKCKRFWPPKTGTEGFFIAKMRKE